MLFKNSVVVHLTVLVCDICFIVSCFIELFSILIGVGYYHAGMSANDRELIHEAFLKDEVPILVATIAFGMGIHKPDIRIVIHVGKLS